MKPKKIDLSSTFLHLIAMAVMLLDHAYAIGLSDALWMNCVGRLAFPIFSFMLVEGYFHTRSLRRYALRLLAAAVVSELPFNLVAGGGWLYPFHQNVMWTLLMSLGAIHLSELARRQGNSLLRLLTAAFTIVGGYILGTLLMVDYYGAGVLTVLLFYFLRGGGWMRKLGQLAGMYYLNCEMLGGQLLLLNVLGATIEFPVQGFAILALIPIWLYRGRQGYHAKWLQRLYYAFYPLHLALLALAVRVF